MKSRYPLLSSNMAGTSPNWMEASIARKISYFYGPCSSQPCLIPGGPGGCQKYQDWMGMVLIHVKSCGFWAIFVKGKLHTIVASMFWLVVWNIFYSPSIGKSHPERQTHIFQMRSNQQPVYIYIYILIYVLHWENHTTNQCLVFWQMIGSAPDIWRKSAWSFRAGDGWEVGKVMERWWWCWWLVVNSVTLVILVAMTSRT